MSADVLADLRNAGVTPYSQLSERGLEAVFSGLVDVVHLAEGEAATLRRDPPRYLTVLRGELAVSVPGGGTATLAAPAHCAAGPLELSGGGGPAQVMARRDSLYLTGECEVIDQILALDLLVRASGGSPDMVQLVLLRQARCFSVLTDAAVVEVLGAMEEIPVKAGQQVIRQNEPGDRFYFIREGAAEVWRAEPKDAAPKCVAVLGPGDSFGEEALILGAGRNATVQMKTAGVLLALGADDFAAMVARPGVRRVSVEEARSRLAFGAQLVDVRYADEWEAGHLPDALHIPLSEVREGSAALDPAREVVVYCRSGHRSQAGAMLLAQMGFKAVSMDGGIMAWPGEVVRPD